MDVKRCLSLPLQVQDYTHLRATGNGVGSVLHTKATEAVLVAALQRVLGCQALIAHLLCLMQPERCLL